MGSFEQFFSQKGWFALDFDTQAGAERFRAAIPPGIHRAPSIPSF